MADRPLSEAEKIKNKADAEKKGKSVEAAVATKKMMPGDPDSPDLAAAAKENAAAAKKAKEPPDPDAPDPNDSPVVAASKKRRREAAEKAKAAGQKGAMRRTTITMHLG
jgi:hypothetical protein